MILDLEKLRIIHNLLTCTLYLQRRFQKKNNKYTVEKVTPALLKHKAGLQRPFPIEFFRSAVFNTNVLFRLIFSFNFSFKTVYIWKRFSPSKIPQINFSN